MSHSITAAAPFLVANIELFKGLDIENGILDLAAGSGRNGLYLAEHNIPVTLADNNALLIEQLNERLRSDSIPAKTWLVDLEAEETNPLAGREYDGILVFNYLHRPLLPAISDAVRAGGLIMYETFTVHQKKLGRPTNPDYLLQEGELKTAFKDWQILHYFEGTLAARCDSGSGNQNRAVAQLLARKQ